MKNEEILTALRRLKVETGSLACMGCGREHDCGIHGCRIAREGCGADREADRPLRALRRGDRGAAGAREMGAGDGTAAGKCRRLSLLGQVLQYVHG